METLKSLSFVIMYFMGYATMYHNLINNITGVYVTETVIKLVVQNIRHQVLSRYYCGFIIQVLSVVYLMFESLVSYFFRW